METKDATLTIRIKPSVKAKAVMIEQDAKR